MRSKLPGLKILKMLRNAVQGPSAKLAFDGVIDTSAAAKRPQRAAVPDLAPALSIPCPDPTGEDRACDMHQSSGLRMARQEDWAGVSAAIHAAEAACERTPGGMPVADLIAFGARSDVVSAAEHALLSGRPAKDAPLLEGIIALEEMLAEFPDDYAIATIVTMTHLDIGWAWRGTGWSSEVPLRNREAFDAHFDRARDILEGFPAEEFNSPLLAAAHCMLRSGLPTDTRRLVTSYERLIALDPLNARALRNFGTHLLPRWHGTVQELEVQARRMASSTHAQWGAGGYTWVMLDAIAQDDAACSQLDVAFFIEGLHDILNRRDDPHTVNLLAAYCANTMGMTLDAADDVAFVRGQIADCAKWIIRRHLTELHPMIWAHAARGFDNNLRVRCPDRFAAAGAADAHRILCDMFRRELSQGNRVVFTDRGAELEPS
ncbi:hypothetical protein [Pseudosulfitobacter koreensis]|uniref:DUF4034 domain-containing protein n=1 Tax=Pseudosulfitobacter koreensis TaxID=2968472 RepID=A0ABT1YZU5_9RHOB|nr:hypothetical protein [Pseudosulfitobacter koreense]MCR8826409.1 hypothetical protein [Pseudosulfitobacter koreense]